jgi:hypothetical protein
MVFEGFVREAGDKLVNNKNKTGIGNSVILSLTRD